MKPQGVARLGRRLHNARWRLRNYRRRVLPHRRSLSAVVAHGGYTVHAGPFAGMRYIEDVSVEHALIPRLLGCYETELQLAIEQSIAGDFDTLIDIGCSEGYYAVGFALRSPRTRVFAFDTDPAMQRRCRAMADRNGVADRVDVGAESTPETIARVALGRTLIISDCEGAEVDVLDPRRAPVLLSCDLIVEVHDLFVPGATQAVRERFEATHHVFVVNSMLQDPRRFAQLQGLRAAERKVALDECRPQPMDWLVMRPRAVTRPGPAGGMLELSDDRHVTSA